MTISEEKRNQPRQTYLFGYPLKRTYAPFLHNKLTQLANIPRRYSKLELHSGMDQFLTLTTADDFGGAVTMPYKVAIMDHIDGATEEGRIIGACNTVFWQETSDGKRQLIGHNTDCIGVRDALLGVKPPGPTGDSVRPGIIIGGGGAARAAVYALHKWLHCSPIYIVNRDDDEVASVMQHFSTTHEFNPTLIHLREVEQAHSISAPSYIVSAVPSFPPVKEGEIRARQVIEVVFNKTEKGVILEMCYFPHPWTVVAEIAQNAGWTVVTGEVAMIWQGIEKLWLECNESDLPVKEVFEIVRNQVALDSKTDMEPPEV